MCFSSLITEITSYYIVFPGVVSDTSVYVYLDFAEGGGVEPPVFILYSAEGRIRVEVGQDEVIRVSIVIGNFDLLYSGMIWNEREISNPSIDKFLSFYLPRQDNISIFICMYCTLNPGNYLYILPLYLLSSNRYYLNLIL